MPVYHRRFGVSRAPLQFFCGSHGQGTPHPCLCPPLILRPWALAGRCWLDAGLICPESSPATLPAWASPDLLAPRCWLLPGSRPPRQGSHKLFRIPRQCANRPEERAAPRAGNGRFSPSRQRAGSWERAGNRRFRKWRFSPYAQRAVSKQGMGLPLYRGKCVLEANTGAFRGSGPVELIVSNSA